MLISRKYVINGDGEILEQGTKDATWEQLRGERDRLLDESDWRVVPDRPDAQEWVDYRSFLRDLPENFPGDNANDAHDAWIEYDKPEGAE